MFACASGGFTDKWRLIKALTIRTMSCSLSNVEFDTKTSKNAVDPADLLHLAKSAESIHFKMDFKCCVVVLTVFFTLCVCVQQVVSSQDNLNEKKEPFMSPVAICCRGSQNCSNEEESTLMNLTGAINLPANLNFSREDPVCDGGELIKHEASWKFHEVMLI